MSPQANKLTVTPEVLDRAIAMAEAQFTSLDNPGICLACHADADGVEPDARRRECEDCGARAVFGYSEIIMMGGL